MKNRDLDSLQHELHRTMNLPVVKDFSASSLIMLCNHYGLKLLELWEVLQQDRMVSAVHSEKIGGMNTQAELRGDHSRLNTFWSKSESLEYPSAKTPTTKQMTLNWQEIYDLLDEAFSDQEEQVKGCELLETLDYKVSMRHGNHNELNNKLVHWLQQAHRFKDQQIKEIYYRLLNLSYEDSKDEQTYQSFVHLILAEVDSNVEMRSNYIRTIDELNSQITDLIAETTKKEIQQGSREPLQEIPYNNNFANHRLFPREEHSTEQKKFKLMEERRSLERNVEDMLAELLALKSDNEDLRARLFERDKQLNGMLMRNGMRDQPQQHNPSNLGQSDRRQFILHSLEKQLSVLITGLPNLTVNKSFRKNLGSMKLDIDNEEDVLVVLTSLNEEMQLVLRRSQPQYSSASADPLEKQLGTIVKMLDRLVVSEGKHGRDLDLIQNLFIEFRTLEASIKAEIRAELIGPKLMGSIARLQKMIGKGDRKMQRLLDVEKGYLLELLGELVPTDRAIDTVSSAEYNEERQFDEVRNSLQAEVAAVKLENEQLKKKLSDATQKEKQLTHKRDEMSKLMVDASRRLVNMEKESQRLQSERGQLLTEVKRLRQNFKQDKQNIRDQVVQKDSQITRLSKQLKHFETVLEQQRKAWSQQRNRLAEQIQLTGTKLEDIQKLAERKLYTAEKQRHRGTPTMRRRMI